MDLLQVALDPVAVAQGRLAGQRLDGHRAAAVAVGVGADGDLDALVGRVLEERVHLGRRLQVDAAHRQQVLAGLDVHAGGGQRRAQLRAPVQAAVDLLEAITAVGDLVIGAEQAAGDRLASRAAVRRARV